MELDMGVRPDENLGDRNARECQGAGYYYPVQRLTKGLLRCAISSKMSPTIVAP
jgi:hypothetical protein